MTQLGGRVRVVARVRPLPATVSVVALFTVLGGTAYALATAGGSSQQVIHACVNNGTGVVRIVNHSGACRRRRRGYPGERPIAWNQTGPLGRTGPIGRTGQVGPTGPIGPSNAYFASTNFELAPPQSDGVSVTVPPGDYTATGGCTSLYVASPGTALAWSTATAELNTGPPAAVATAVPYGAQASVPNTGNDVIDGHGDIQYGSAALSDSGGFSLPTGGEISQSCSNSVTRENTGLGGGVTLFHLVVTRVATLQSTAKVQ